MKRLMFVLVILASSLLYAATAYAQASARIAVSGNFQIVTWQNTSITQVGQNTIVKSVYTETVTGSATGSVTGEQTAIVHPNGTQTVSGVDTCLCTISGKSFIGVLRFQAAGNLSGVNGTWAIINGDQTGVTGNGVFSVNLVTGEIDYSGAVQLGQ